MKRLALLLLLLAPLPGCRSHLRPYDPTPLATAESRPTAGGERLLLDEDGALLRGHGVGDPAGALGVELAQLGSAVVVGAPRPGREAAGLVQGDELLFAVPVAPWLPGPAPRQADAVRAGGPLPDAPGPAGFPIRSLDDLRGLAIGVEGLAVDLVLLRSGQRQVVRVTLVASEAVAARPWTPALADPLGVSLVRLDDWPADRRPAGATAQDLLVTRVARGGLGCKAGLRPLDLVRGEGGRFDVRMGSFPPFLPEELTDAIRAAPDWRQATVVRADGREATLVLPEPEAPTDVGFPLLFVYQSDGLAWHVGLLPFDLLFHASGESEHDPRTDTVGEQSRWSFLTTFQVQEIEGGADDVATVKIDPVFDEARMRYASWLLDPAISR